jgi:hypothetical protein
LTSLSSTLKHKNINLQTASRRKIAKALFEQIQQAKIIPNTKTPWGTQQFAYKDIFKCGTCGANITVEEKIKPTKDGD